MLLVLGRVKMVRWPGFAPESPRSQRGALLIELRTWKENGRSDRIRTCVISVPSRVPDF